MLTITIPGKEYWDDNTEQFLYINGKTLQLEHSLISLSKWESKWNKAFLSKRDKTYEETLDYIKCMTLTQNVDPLVYYGLTVENIEQINRYIEAPMTAVYFPNDKGAVSRDTVTAELIYYWMITLNIPFECQKWHLNRLIALIKVCGMKNSPPKKTNGRALANSYKELNAARRKQLNTKG